MIYCPTCEQRLGLLDRFTDAQICGSCAVKGIAAPSPEAGEKIDYRLRGAIVLEERSLTLARRCVITGSQLDLVEREEQVRCVPFWTLICFLLPGAVFIFAGVFLASNQRITLKYSCSPQGRRVLRNWRIGFWLLTLAGLISCLTWAYTTGWMIAVGVGLLLGALVIFMTRYFPVRLLWSRTGRPVIVNLAPSMIAADVTPGQTFDKA